jgi:hypothetical protein
MRMKMKRTLVIVEPIPPTRNIHASVWREVVSLGERERKEEERTVRMS